MSRPITNKDASKALAEHYGALWFQVFEAIGDSHNKRAAALGMTVSVEAAKVKGRGVPPLTERALLCTILEEFGGDEERLRAALLRGIARMRKEDGKFPLARAEAPKKKTASQKARKKKGAS